MTRFGPLTESIYGKQDVAGFFEKAVASVRQSVLSNRSDAELALLVRHLQSALKVATENLAEALAEQSARERGETSYEAPSEIVAWFPQHECGCCAVPTPQDDKVCGPCAKAHGNHASKTCERAAAMWAGYAEYNPNEGKPRVATVPLPPSEIERQRRAAWQFDPGVSTVGGRTY